MVANGVIGITASILESSDIGSPDNPDKHKESFFDKMKRWTTHIGKNWKGMVKKGATAGFYALLAGSKIMQGITKSMFGIVGSLIDILLSPFIPFISNGIQWLADIVRAVGDFIKNMPETFKKIWEPIWDYIYGIARGAGDKILGIFEKKGAELNSDGSGREELLAKTIGSDKGPLISDTERDAFLDGTGSGDDPHLIDEPITKEDVDAEYESIQENIDEKLPTDEEVRDVHQSYVDGIEAQLELPSEERIAEVKEEYATGFAQEFKLPSDEEIDEVKESYSDAVYDQFTLPSQEEVTAVQDSYVEAMEIPADKLEEAVYGKPTWLDDDPNAPANPSGGPINQFHVQNAVTKGDIVGLPAEDAEEFGKEEMDKWYNSWINDVPEFKIEEILTSIVPDDWDPVKSVTELFTSPNKIGDEDLVEGMLEMAVSGPPVPVKENEWANFRYQPMGGGSRTREERPPLSHADQLLMELYFGGV